MCKLLIKYGPIPACLGVFGTSQSQVLLNIQACRFWALFEHPGVWGGVDKVLVWFSLHNTHNQVTLWISHSETQEAILKCDISNFKTCEALEVC